MRAMATPSVSSTSPVLSRSLLAAALLTLSPACAEDAPSPALVEDLRVLAVRAEPPELLFDREELTREDLLAGSARPVHFEALVVDPRGGAMVYDWQFCPVESSETCGDYERRKASGNPAFGPVLDAARAQELRGMAQIAPDGVLATPGGAGIGFDVRITPQLFGYHFFASALGLGNGAWASAVLKLETAGEALQAQKRVVLNARDLGAFNPELAASGFQICPDPATGLTGAPGCLPLRPRTPNHNPELLGFEIARGVITAPFEPLAAGAPLLLAPKEKVWVRPVVAADAEEPYQTIESALQGNRLTVVDHREELVASWFATAGEFEEEQTAVQLSKTITNEFTAPERAGALGKDVTLFVVVRDQRGGVGWSRLAVHLQ
jgi:hypothetical protein